MFSIRIQGLVPVLYILCQVFDLCGRPPYPLLRRPGGRLTTAPVFRDC